MQIVVEVVRTCIICTINEFICDILMKYPFKNRRFFTADESA